MLLILSRWPLAETAVFVLQMIRLILCEQCSAKKNVACFCKLSGWSLEAGLLQNRTIIDFVNDLNHPNRGRPLAKKRCLFLGMIWMILLRMIYIIRSRPLAKRKGFANSKMSSDGKKIIIHVFARCFEISFWFESNNVASSCVDLHCVLGRGLVGQMERLVANWLSAELPIINRSSKSSSLSDKNHHHWIILIIIIISSKLSVFLWSPYDQNRKINITKTFQ